MQVLDVSTRPCVSESGGHVCVSEVQAVAAEIHWVLDVWRETSGRTHRPRPTTPRISEDSCRTKGKIEIANRSFQRDHHIPGTRYPQDQFLPGSPITLERYDGVANFYGHWPTISSVLLFVDTGKRVEVLKK